MEISTFSAHPADGSLTRRDLSGEHFCKSECEFTGNQKNCLRYFYASANAKDIINPEKLTSKIPDWEPLVDQATNQMQRYEESWYKELKPYIDPVESLRNTTYDSCPEINNYTIDLKAVLYL